MILEFMQAFSIINFDAIVSQFHAKRVTHEHKCRSPVILGLSPTELHICMSCIAAHGTVAGTSLSGVKSPSPRMFFSAKTGA